MKYRNSKMPKTSKSQDGEPSQLQEAQRHFMQYLNSPTHNFTDPQIALLPTLSLHGYSSLETFIEDIPMSVIQETSIPRFNQVSVLPTSGMRYILREDPTIKGTLVFHNEEAEEMIIRRDNRQEGRMFSMLKWVSKWASIIIGIFLWRKVDLFQWYTNLVANKTFPASQLQLERDYLRSLLPPPQLDTLVGIHRGIEGGLNSCYLDSLLFSMFYTTSIFDSILEEKPTDSAKAKEVRSTLRNSIVPLLRTPPAHFCPSSETMKLREQLSSFNSSLMGSFMDVEELLYILLQECLKEEEFMKYAEEDDWGDFMHLMKVDLEDSSDVIAVQQCMETSFTLYDMKLSGMPHPAFILGMPRSNRKLVHYKAVIPNPTIDISPILAQSLKSSPHHMRLSAIIGIRGVHFTAFAYCQETDEWLYFDSMAGPSSEVRKASQLHRWLCDLSEKPKAYEELVDKMPIEVDRAIHDGHICIYEPILNNT